MDCLKEVVLVLYCLNYIRQAFKKYLIFLYFVQNSSFKINLKVNNVNVQHVKKIAFLGRQIADSQAVGHHYAKAIQNAQNNVNLLKMFIYIKGNINPKHGLNFYKSFVRSKVEYARTSTAHAPAYIQK